MSRGFTLLEIVIALGLVVLLSGLVMPALLGRMGAARVEGAIRDVESAALIARAESQQEGRAVLLLGMRTTSGQWAMISAQAGDGTEGAAVVRAWLSIDDTIDTPERRRMLVVLPEGTSLARTETDMDDRTDSRIAVAVFLPDGSALALGRVVLTARDGSRRPIVVREWSGLVTVGQQIREDEEDEEIFAFGAVLIAAAWRRRSRSPNRLAARAGGIMLEVIVSVAILAMCGLTILGAIGQAMHSFQVTRERTTAADLTRSAMAKLEAGIASTTMLDGPVLRWEFDPDSGAEAMGDVPSAGSAAAMDATGWELEVDVYPSQFSGLSVVTISAVRVPTPTTSLRGERRVLHTLTQLVRLGGAEEDIAGEEDALLGGGR